MNNLLYKFLLVWLIVFGVHGACEDLAAQTTDTQQDETADEEQDEQDEQEQDETTEQSDEEKAARERARQRREEESETRKDGTVFKPSEEISEDVPAPFPIDI